MALAVKNPPAVQQMQVQSLGQEDPMKEEIETHSSILVWKILWAEEPGRLQSMGSQRVRHDWAHDGWRAGMIRKKKLEHPTCNKIF